MTKFQAIEVRNSFDVWSLMLLWMSELGVWSL